MSVPFHDISGQRFGRVLVVARDGMTSHAKPVIRWRCVCDCGSTFYAIAWRLKAGRTVSCGCIRAARCMGPFRKHKRGPNRDWAKKYGLAYASWSSMRRRCLNPNHRSFKNYGGRGIKICDSWDTFWQFLKDMGDRPSKEHTLDRKDNEKGYTPENCRWATLDVQARNCRTNKTLTYLGETLCLSDWSKKTGIPRSTLNRRFYKGTLSAALILSAEKWTRRNAPK